jgi:hypothetical protein
MYNALLIEGRATFFLPCESGSNPTIVRYNASTVKIYKATGSLVRFKNNIHEHELVE